MKVEIVKNESKEIVLEFYEHDLTVPEMVAGRLVNNEDVSFAGIMQEHPEVGKPRLVLKTVKHNALTTLSKSVDEIEEDLSELKTQLSKKK